VGGAIRRRGAHEGHRPFGYREPRGAAQRARCPVTFAITS
jgi:hypothetical protein